MVVRIDGEAAGSVSGGCVEGAVYEVATEVRETGVPQRTTYGISDDDAFEVGLTCGGILERHGTLAPQKYPGVRVARTIDELLADEQIRLCVIATPNLSHFELAQRCLLAGRDRDARERDGSNAQQQRTPGPLDQRDEQRMSRAARQAPDRLRDR